MDRKLGRKPFFGCRRFFYAKANEVNETNSSKGRKRKKKFKGGERK